MLEGVMIKFNNKCKLDLDTSVALIKKSVLQIIHSEANIEGVAVTMPQTEEICGGEDELQSKYRNSTVAVVQNIRDAYKYVIERVTDGDFLDLDVVSRINRFVCGRGMMTTAGQLRSCAVSITGTAYRPDIPDSVSVRNRIADIVNNKNATETEKALDIMLYIMRGQLFEDGNKRTAQIAANFVLVKAGVGYLEIPVEQIGTFRKLLTEYYDSNVGTDIKLWLYENCVKER
jgi:prophage maintenance system killer protein